MLRVPERALPEPARSALERYQAEVDAVVDYAERVQVGKKRFKAYNRASNSTFAVVRETLREMCGGIARCMYCEDSAAHEIEHIKPKALYPELVFAWMNYLYACGLCNRGKGQRYYVFTEGGECNNVARRLNAPSEPPPGGEPVLLDPRREDPSEWLQLDLWETFRFVPRHARDSRDWQRADLTIDILGLNRDILIETRQNAYETAAVLLKQYSCEKREGAVTERLEKIRDMVLNRSHPTVWAEMKRQCAQIPALKGLFAEAPEALGWES